MFVNVCTRVKELMFVSVWTILIVVSVVNANGGIEHNEQLSIT